LFQWLGAQRVLLIDPRPRRKPRSGKTPGAPAAMNVRNTTTKTTNGPPARSIPVFKFTTPEIADAMPAALKLRMVATTMTCSGLSSGNPKTIANVSTIPKIPHRGKFALAVRVRLTDLAAPVCLLPLLEVMSVSFISILTLELGFGSNRRNDTTIETCIVVPSLADCNSSLRQAQDVNLGSRNPYHRLAWQVQCATRDVSGWPISEGTAAGRGVRLRGRISHPAAPSSMAIRRTGRRIAPMPRPRAVHRVPVCRQRSSPPGIRLADTPPIRPCPIPRQYPEKCCSLINI